MTETAVSTEQAALTGDYAIDASHSRIGFAAKHAMVTTVRGAFGGVEGTAHLDFEHPENSTAQLEIDVTTISTGSADRDAHLRSGDFFDVENFPKITFVSTGVTQKKDDTYVLQGDLTIKGVSKPVEVEFELTGVNGDPWGNTRAGFEGRTTVNRKDWGLTWNVAMEKGGWLVGEKITLNIEAEVVEKA